MTNRHVIEHDADEPPRDTSKPPWLAAGIVLGVAWAGSLYLFSLDWHSVGLGFMTGGLLASWAIEVTGDKVPKSWRGTPSRD